MPTSHVTRILIFTALSIAVLVSGTTSSKRSTFVQQCTNFLLSSDRTNDGVISQIEFVDMLLHQCHLDNLCNGGLKLNFGQLDVRLRVKFIRGICSRSSDHPDRFDCIYNLYEMMRDESLFGFDTNAVGVEDLVKDMCSETYPDAVDFGFVKTQVPSNSPDAGWTGPPSSEISHVPSISPSQDSSSSSPSTIIVSNSPTAADTLRPTSVSSLENPSSFPSDMPSTFTPIDNGNVDSSAPDVDDNSISAGEIAGITSAALFATLAFVAYMYRSPSHIPSPNMKSSKDAYNFGVSAYEPLGKSGSSLPIPFMGLNCSVCSSSSSYRDYRFVNVFGPRGTPIPQFNPNTAGAVVIGSVTIRASSSYSSGPYGNSGSSQVRSTKSPLIFTRRKRFHHRHDAPKSDSGISSRDDVSSISSRKSSYQRRMKRRSSNHYRKIMSIRLDRRDVDQSAAHLPLSSIKSSLTVPLSYRQRRRMDKQLISDSQVSFGDWRATWDLSECRPTIETADQEAILAHRRIVFNTLCPESTQLPDENMTPSSSGCHSLPNMHFVPRASSSDAGSSSVLSESYFLDGSSLRQQQSVASSIKSASTSPFVPWRSEGFISSRMSDSRQSNESETNVPKRKKRFEVIRRPAKAIIAKYKSRTSIKDWFTFRSSRQYHYLHKQDGVVALQEDPEVLSMNSYSSNVRLLPPCEESERADLPYLVLGTFAAASMPIGQKVALPKLLITTSFANEANDGVIRSNEQELHCADEFEQPSTNFLASRDPEPFSVDHISAHPTIRTQTVKDISSLDANGSFIDSKDSSSISAYSRSDFESSTTTSPSKTVSNSSYTSPATADTSQSSVRHGIDLSFAALTADVDESVVVLSNVLEDCVSDESSSNALYESKRVGQPRGKRPSLLCIGSVANEFNVVSESGSETGNFTFPSDEEDDDVVASRNTTGQEHAPNLITPIEPSTFFPGA